MATSKEMIIESLVVIWEKTESENEDANMMFLKAIDCLRRVKEITHKQHMNPEGFYYNCWELKTTVLILY